MGTMRNNFEAVFVLFVLTIATSQSLPHGYEDSTKRNSLVDSLNPDRYEPSTSTIYKCLFVEPDLPICDAERMLSSDEESAELSDQDLNKDSATRSRRNADVNATTAVVVYTIEGCLPPRLPFSLPSCDGVPLDKIVDVQRLRPFVVKDVTGPPLVFPKFDYDKWANMIKRLKDSVTRDVAQNGIAIETQTRNPLKERIMELTKAKVIPRSVQSTIKERRSPFKTLTASNYAHIKSSESRESFASTSVENDGEARVSFEDSSEDMMDDVASLLNLQEIEKSKTQPKTLSDYKEDVWKSSNDKILKVEPMMPFRIPLTSHHGRLYSYERIDDPVNDHETDRKFGSISNSLNNYGDSNIYDLIETTSFELRKGREIRSSVNGISDDQKSRGIAGKSLTPQFKTSNECSGTLASTIPSTTTQNPRNRSKPGSQSASSRFSKIDFASRKASWRRAMMKEEALGKKHRTYMELPTPGSQ